MGCGDETCFWYCVIQAIHYSYILQVFKASNPTVSKSSEHHQITTSVLFKMPSSIALISTFVIISNALYTTRKELTHGQMETVEAR
jgi:hypothetical protein